MKINGKIKAKAPLHIGGEKQSNLTTLARITIGDKEIPYLPGNSIRGCLRRLLVEDFFRQINQKEMTESEYFFHFVGGALTTSKQSSDMELKRDFISFLPHIRFFGTSYGNETIQGKLCVSSAMPIGEPKTEFIQMTRKDDLKSDLSKDIKIIKDKKKKEKEQMIFYIETMVRGSEYKHDFFIHNPTDLDKSILSRLIELWKEKPYIGGMSARGLGEIELEYDLDIDSSGYFEFIKKHKKEISKVMKKVK